MPGSGVLADRLAARPPADKLLVAAVRRSGLRQRMFAVGLATPLLVLICLGFLVPIAALLTRAVYDPTIADNLPRTSVALQGWNQNELPDDAAFRAFSLDLVQCLNQGHDL